MNNCEVLEIPSSFLDLNISVTKSGIDAGVTSDGNKRIWVLASTEDEDEDSETLVQKAMDISYLEKDGKFLWGHSDPKTGRVDPEDVLGTIERARITSEGLYVEGSLLKGKRKAKVIYDDLKNNPDLCPHKASIEGTYQIMITSDGMVQKSAIVRNIAFDVNVKNTYTMAGVLKSLRCGRPDCNCEEIIPLMKSNREKMGLYLAHNILCRNMNYIATKDIARQYLHETLKVKE